MSQADQHTQEFVVWVIYDHPRDFPQYFVVRPQIVWGGLIRFGVATTYETLEQARSALPPGLYPLGRHESDDPAIAEVWI